MARSARTAAVKRIRRGAPSAPAIMAETSSCGCAGSDEVPVLADFFEIQGSNEIGMGRCVLPPGRRAADQAREEEEGSLPRPLSTNPASQFSLSLV
ncbi:unnamed protein product [Urochloa humidicola]